MVNAIKDFNKYFLKKIVKRCCLSFGKLLFNNMYKINYMYEYGVIDIKVTSEFLPTI